MMSIARKIHDRGLRRSEGTARAFIDIGITPQGVHFTNLMLSATGFALSAFAIGIEATLALQWCFVTACTGGAFVCLAKALALTRTQRCPYGPALRQQVARRLVLSGLSTATFLAAAVAYKWGNLGYVAWAGVFVAMRGDAYLRAGWPAPEAVPPVRASSNR